MIKFRSFYKLEKLLGWFYFCLSIDLSLPRNRVNSVEHLHGKLGIRTPVLNRSIAEQAKDILLFCSTNVSQTDGFPSFISLRCRCHSTACAWAAAGQRLSRTCTCFQNPVLIKGWCLSPGQEIPCWLCVFNVTCCGNRVCCRGDDPSHKSKLGWWGFDQTLWCSKKGKKCRLDKYFKSSIQNQTIYYMKLEILKNTMYS